MNSPRSSCAWPSGRVSSNRSPVHERRLAAKRFDIVPSDVVHDHVLMVADDVSLAADQVAYRDFGVERIFDPVEPALAKAREIERRFSQRLAGQRSCVDRGASDWTPLNEGNALSEVGSLRRPLLASRSGADHDQVVRSALVHHAAPAHPTRAPARNPIPC